MNEDKFGLQKEQDTNYDKVLHFGATVYLQPEAEDGSESFLYSEGFIIKGVIHQDFTNTNADFCGSLFRVVPGYQYEMQKKLQKRTETLEDPMLSNRILDKEEIEKMIDQLDKELKNNQETLTKLKNTKIVFGQNVQFEHVASHKFLSFHPDIGGTGAGDNFTLQLQDIPSEFSVFKILPCYKYQCERDKFIKFDDDILISSALEKSNKDAFLVINRYEKLVPPAKLSNAKDDKSDSESELGLAKNILEDFVITFERSSKFRIKCFCPCPSEEDLGKLNFGDVVWISHIERETCLEYRKKIEKQSIRGKSTGRKNSSMSESEVKDEGFGEVVDDIQRKNSELSKIFVRRSDGLYFELSENNDLRNTIAMWKIESDKYLNGGPVFWNSLIRFRNLSNGFYLSAKKVASYPSPFMPSYGEEQIILTLEKKPSEDSLFMLRNREFSPLGEESKIVNSDAFFGIFHKATEQTLGVEMDQEVTRGKLIEKIFWRPTLRKKACQADTLRFFKAVSSEIWETRFLLSCLPIIRSGIRLIKKMNEEEEAAKDFYKLKFSRKTGLELLKECLENIMNFVYFDPRFSSSLNEIGVELGTKKPNYYRQRILREHGFLFLLSQIVQATFPNPRYLKKIMALEKAIDKRLKARKSHSSKAFNSRKSVWLASNKTMEENSIETLTLFVDITRLCYRLIKGICKDNYENGLECFKYAKTFKAHTGYHLGASTCIISLLRDNEKLLSIIHVPEKEMDQITSNNFRKGKSNSKIMRSSMFWDNKSTLVNFFVEQYDELKKNSIENEHWHKLLDFLNTICKYKQTGITVNQMLINEAILQNPQANDKILLRLYEKNEAIMVKTRDTEQECELLEFVRKINKETFIRNTKLAKTILYIQKQLELFSNLCFGRNYVNKKMIKQILSMKVIMNYIWKEELSGDIRAVLISNLLNVHIDTKPRTERMVPLLTKTLGIMASPTFNKRKLHHNESIFGANIGFGKEKTLMKNMTEAEKDTKAVDHQPNTKTDLKGSGRLQEVVIDIKKINAITKTLKKPKTKGTNQETVKTSQPEKITVQKNATKSYFEPESPGSEYNGQIIEEFIKEEESVDMENDMKVLKEKIVEFLKNGVKVKKDSGKEFVVFDDLLLNITKLVKKLIAFESFSPTETKKANANQATPHNKKNKLNLHAFDDFSTLMNSLIHLLEFENKGVKRETYTKEEKKEEKREEKKKTTKIFSMLNESLKELNKKNEAEKEDSQFVVTKVETQPAFTKTTAEKRESYISLTEVGGEMSLGSLILRKKFLRYAEVKDRNQDEEREEPVDVSIKLEIIQIMIYIMDLRHDTFISTIIDHIQNFCLSLETKNPEIISKETEDQISKFINQKVIDSFPNIMDNGLESTGERSTRQQFNGNHRVFPDFDKMYSKPTLPLLIQMFMKSSEFGLSKDILTLIFKCFSQRTALVHSMKKIQVLQENADHQTFELLKTKVENLKFVCEQSELWLTTTRKMNSSSFKYKYIIYRVIDILKEFIILLYANTEIDHNDAFYLENMEKQLDDVNISRTRQIMMKNLGTHLIILKLLKDGTYVMEDIKDKHESNKVIVDVFELCYAFLLKFCMKDNKENKKALFSNLNLFMDHLDFYDMGQIALINEIFKNNYNHSLQVKEELLQAYLEKISSNDFKQGGHDPIYLELFDNIMFDKTEPVKENCRKIVKVIIESNKKYSFLFMKENKYYIDNSISNKNSKRFHDIVAEKEREEEIKKNYHLFGHHMFDFDLDSSTENDVPYIYHSRALRILLNCIKHSDDKQFLKFILQKTFNINYLFELLSMDDVYVSITPSTILQSIINEAILSIINEIWLTTDKPPSSIFNNKFVVKFVKKNISILERITKDDIERIKKRKSGDLDKEQIKIHTVKEEKKEDDDDNEDGDNTSEESFDEEEEHRNRNYHRYAEIAEKYAKEKVFDFYEHLFDNLVPTIISLNKVLMLNERNTENIKGREDLTSLNDFVEALVSFNRTQIEDLSIFKDVKKVCALLGELENIFMVNFGRKLDENPNEELTKKLSDSYIDQLPLQNILNHRNSLTHQYLGRENLWRTFLLNLLSNDFVKDKLLIPERDHLVVAIKEIDKLSYPSEDFKKPSVSEFIKQLFSFLKLGLERDPETTEKLSVSIIKLIEDIIDSCEGQDKKEKQDLINDQTGVTKTTLMMLCDKSTPLSTYRELINLSIKLLEGGNSNVQECFYEFFITNSTSENFFAILNQMINDEIIFQNKEKSMHEKIDICINQIEYSYRLSPRFSIANILKLLQLLTENHFEKMQNYFRYQFNSRNNYDILNIIVKLLDCLVGDLNEVNYYKAIQCLETLTEFIQGPCEANQQSLGEGRIIDIICKILMIDDSYDTKPATRRNRGKNQRILERMLNLGNNPNFSKRGHHQSIPKLEEEDVLQNIFTYLKKISSHFAEKFEDSFDRHKKNCIDKWMQSRLKYKSVITLESLLEGQTNPYFVKRVMKSLSLDNMKDNLGWVYEKFAKLYEKKYTNDVFNHGEWDESKERNSEYMTLIIETGFKLFIILKKYVEMDPADDEEKNETLELFKKEFNNLLGSDNLVQQIGSFGIDLIKTGFSAVERQITKITKVISNNNIEEVEGGEGKGPEKEKRRNYNKEALTFFGKYTSHIELNRQGKLYKQYFPMLPHCLCLDKEIKMEFENGVNRDSLKSKVSCLLERSEEIIERLKYEERLLEIFAKNTLLSLLQKHVTLWKDISFIVCIAQNAIILKITENIHIFEFKPIFMQDFSYGNDKYSSPLLTLEMIQIAVSCLVLIFFLFKRAPLLITRARKKLYKPKKTDKKKEKRIRIWTIIYRFFRDNIVYIKCLLTDWLLLYYILYTLFAIMGIFNPVFAALLLFDIFLRFPVLLHVLNSLWRPRYQILLTLVLFFILGYFFTFISYYFFYEKFEDLCENFLQCFSLVFDTTFKWDGGIGGFFKVDSTETQNRPDKKTISSITIFDFLFIFTMIILIFQIISGIIIDTFAVLREEEEKKKDDMENFCFVCGFDRATLDKKCENKKGFTYHVKVEHNMWNYVFYISYIKDKLSTEYTGFESYVADKLDNYDISWFPLHQAMSLNSMNKEKEEEDNKASSKYGLPLEAEEKLDDIDNKLQNLYFTLKRPMK